MDNPFEQYHKEPVTETNSKRIIDRVNAQIAPGGMSIVAIATLVTVATMNLIALIWLVLILLVRQFYPRLLNEQRRKRGID
ncbi:hypothetical protein OIDMADRAFT_53792 [Oidiodendron maius Zn]|uniref:Uncharacterized protein n=1 Tax=Oidiodendron maius (strain Zn) TaxID=913774 RepID=A0A0C3HGP6_OIDMZ|nr:hypothetical protein OIDMADRAFT_53792 [Oidiodendron maius Zn]